MSVNAGEVIYKIFGDDSPIKKTLGKVGGFAAKSLAGIGAATAAASAAITKLAEESIKAYADQEQLIGGVETLFGAGGRSIEEYAAAVGKTVSEVQDEYEALMNAQETVLGNAANAFKTAGMSANEYMETVTGFSAALIASMGGDTEAAAAQADKAIIDMADNANKMGSSLESIQNAYQGFAKQNYTMLDNLKLGYGGTKEEMERLLSDAEKLAGTKFDISSFADITEAIHVIQENMDIAGTTAKEAEKTITGSMYAMSAAWKNALAGMSDSSADMDKLINDLSGTVQTFLANVMPRIEEVLPGIANSISSIAAELLPKIPELVNASLPEVLGGANALIEALLDVLGSLAETGIPIISENAKSIINTFVTGLADNLPTLIGTAADMITSLASALLSSENISTISKAAVDILLSLVQGISENLPELVPAAVAAVIEIADNLINNVDKILDGAEELIKALAKGLIDSLPILIDKAPKIISDLLIALVEAIPDTIEFAVELCDTIASNLLGYDWTAVGAKMHQNISEAIENALNGNSNFVAERDAAAAKRIEQYSNLTAEQIDNWKSNASKKLGEFNSLWLDWQNGSDYDTVIASMSESTRIAFEHSGQTLEAFLSDNISQTQRLISELDKAYSEVDRAAKEHRESIVYGSDASFADEHRRIAEENAQAAKNAAMTTAKAGTEFTDTVKKITDDEAKALKTAAQIDLANGIISEEQFYNVLEGIKNQLGEESKLYDSYALEIAKGRQKLREAREKEDEKDRKQAEKDEAARTKKNLEDSVTDLKIKKANEGWSDSKYYDELEKLISGYADKTSDEYKKYELQIAEGRRRIADTEEKEAQKEAEKRSKAIENVKNKIIDKLKKAAEEEKKEREKVVEKLEQNKEKLADSMKLSGDIFSEKSETDPHTGVSSKSRKVDTDALEKKVTARKKLVDKIAKLLDAGVPDDIINELLNADPEAALEYANQLLNSPQKLKKVKNLYEQDEGYRNAIASLVVENSDEYKALGEDTGTAFGEGFISTFGSLWDGMFKGMYSDSGSLMQTMFGVMSANANIPKSSVTRTTSNTDNVVDTLAAENNQAAKKSSSTVSGSDEVKCRMVDVNDTWLMNLVMSKAQLLKICGGG